MPNSFSLENCVHCFNHTLQLSMKTLLHPFNIGLGKMTDDGDNNDVDNLLDANDNGLDEDDNNDDDDNDSLLDIMDVDYIDDSVDELDALDVDKWEDIIADTATIHEMVSKACNSFHQPVTFNWYIHDSFATLLSPLYDQQPFPFLHGDAIAKSSNWSHTSSPIMLLLIGTQHTICLASR